MAAPTDLKALAIKLATEGPHRTLPTPRQISLLFNGVYIARTTHALLVWEHPFYPQLYIPLAAFDAALASSQLHITHGEPYYTAPSSLPDHPDSDPIPIATPLTLTVASRSTDRAFLFSPSSSSSSSLIHPASAPLKDLVKIDFPALDLWLEESSPIRVHPKDPFRRVDCVLSTRPVRVSLNGVLLADAPAGAVHCYETGLPVRFYLPFASLETGVLRGSERVTECPYKGKAEYYSVEVDGVLHENLVWYYQNPLVECAKIEGLYCFYNEKVDIELDGELLERPKSHFKPPTKE